LEFLKFPNDNSISDNGHSKPLFPKQFSTVIYIIAHS
jgi:hypothetical protein